MAKETFSIDTLPQRLATNKTWWRVAFWLPLIFGVLALAAGALVTLFLFTAVAPWIVGAAAGGGLLVLGGLSLFTWGGHARFLERLYSNDDVFQGTQLFVTLSEGIDNSDNSDNPDKAKLQLFLDKSSNNNVVNLSIPKNNSVAEFSTKKFIQYEALSAKIESLFASQVIIFNQGDQEGLGASYANSVLMWYKTDILVALAYQIKHADEYHFIAIAKHLKALLSTDYAIASGSSDFNDIFKEKRAKANRLFEDLCDILGLQLNSIPEEEANWAKPKKSNWYHQRTYTKKAEESSKNQEGAQYPENDSNEVDMDDMYNILGLKRGHANAQDVKKAYRKQALKLHPDKNSGNEIAATEEFKALQAAFEKIVECDQEVLASAVSPSASQFTASDPVQQEETVEDYSFLSKLFSRKKAERESQDQKNNSGKTPMLIGGGDDY